MALMRMRVSLFARTTSNEDTGVPKSVASNRRIRFFGSSVPAKSTMIWLPTWRWLICVRGSVSFTTTRPAPSGPRRKSMLRIPRGAAMAAEEVEVALARGAATPAADCGFGAPSVTTMLLPSRRVSYGISRSRFSTRRVRSFASAARIVSRPAGLHVDAPGGQRQRRVRQVEGDARRVIDGERKRLGRRSRQAHRDLQLLTRQRLHVDRLELGGFCRHR